MKLVLFVPGPHGGYWSVQEFSSLGRVRYMKWFGSQGRADTNCMELIDRKAAEISRAASLAEGRELPTFSRVRHSGICESFGVMKFQR